MLSEELEKLGNRILSDLENFLVESDGNLKDTLAGTHIKIPLAVGYVSCWTSQTDFAITIYLRETITKT